MSRVTRPAGEAAAATDGARIPPSRSAASIMPPRHVPVPRYVSRISPPYRRSRASNCARSVGTLLNVFVSCDIIANKSFTTASGRGMRSPACTRLAAEKGPDARRRPTAAREAYLPYVERAAEGANEAYGPLSASWLEFHVGIEPVAQGIPHQVDDEGREEDREAREGGDPPRVEHVEAALAQHVAPRRRGRLDAEAQEGQERLEDDHLSHLQRRDDHDCRGEVGHDLAEHDPQVAHAEGAAGHHELALADRHGLRPHHARVDGPAGDAEHDDHVDQARPQHGDHREGEQHEREGEHHVHERHDRPVAAPAEVARREPQQHPDACRQAHRCHPHHQRDAAAVDHARQEVAADLVRAEQVLPRAALHPRGRRQPVADVDGEGIVGRDPGREDGGAYDQEENGGGGQPPAQPQEAADAGAALARLEAHLAELGELHLGRRVGRRHAPARMRGSIRPTSRSTIRFTETMTRASRITAHCTTGKSWLRIDSTVSVATPGQANTVSVMIAPPRSWPNCRPSTVMTGMHALRNACFTTTRASLTPLARAVLMKSMFMTSITPDRTRRMVIGASAAPRQNDGIRKFCQLP